MFQIRGRVHFTVAPDPGGNRAKRLAPRRVPAAPDSSIVSPIDLRLIVVRFARQFRSERPTRCAQEGFQ